MLFTVNKLKIGAFLATKYVKNVNFTAIEMTKLKTRDDMKY